MEIVVYYIKVNVMVVRFLDNFRIQLLTQNWIDNVSDDGKDLCSHGKVQLMINGIVLSNENSGDWTVASSGLKLMKSAIYGYDSGIDFELISCCGYLRMFPSCNRYITWDTEINDNLIIISNIQCPEVDKEELKPLSGKIEIQYMEYTTQVLNFANKVIEFYSSSLPKQFYSKYEEEEYKLFWKEFNEYHQTLTEDINKKN